MEKLRYPRQAKREHHLECQMFDQGMRIQMNKMQILALTVDSFQSRDGSRLLGCCECAIMVTRVWECRGHLGCIFRGDGVSSDI